MRLVVHIGVHRTGTTALQGVLSQNTDRLGREGFFYPPHEGGRHRHQRRELAYGGQRAKDALDAIFGAAPAGCHTVILSEESFSKDMEVGWLALARERAEVEVACYLLRQDLWLMSWYNQNVKVAWDPDKAELTPAAFLDRIAEFHWIDYRALLDRWAGQVGADRVHVGVREPGQVDDSTADFCARWELGALEAVRPSHNRSLPTSMLEFARRLNHASLPREHRQRIASALTAVAQSGSMSNQPIYSPSTRNAVLDRFRESNEDVARRYLGRPDGRLFNDDHVPDDASYAEPALPDVDSLMRDIVGPMVRTLSEGEGAAAAVPAPPARKRPWLSGLASGFNPSRKPVDR